MHSTKCGSKWMTLEVHHPDHSHFCDFAVNSPSGDIMEKVALDDLPQYSPWPARLVGLQPWEQRRKTADEIDREYEREKWGPLLKRVRGNQGKVSVEMVDEWNHSEEPKGAILIANELYRASELEAHNLYISLVEKAIEEELPVGSLVELGAGYGSIILNLLKRKRIYCDRFIAAEYTQSGSELIRALAVRDSLPIQIGYCDITKEGITELPIPSGALIFTSYAVMCIPMLQDRFVDDLLRFMPKAVIHFEPIYESFEPSTLLGLMQQRYTQVNDYNRNLFSVLKAKEEERKIKIKKFVPSWFGINPFTPSSLVVWSPII